MLIVQCTEALPELIAVTLLCSSSSSTACTLPCRVNPIITNYPTHSHKIMSIICTGHILVQGDADVDEFTWMKFVEYGASSFVKNGATSSAEAPPLSSSYSRGLNTKRSLWSISVTCGLLPCGHSRLSSLTAVYRPPNPPPRMQILGAMLSLSPACHGELADCRRALVLLQKPTPRWICS